MIKTAKEVVFSLLIENTGTAMGDSGGESGRHWQRNAGKSLADFEKEPSASIDWGMPEKEGETADSTDLSITASVFHYLPSVLEQDELCAEFNALPVKDWEGEAYGVSKKGEAWLKAHGFTYGESWNTYNGESFLSQTLQGTELKKDGCGEGDYVLIQVHGGADVRGGYTDAKLFKYREFQSFINPTPYITATLTKKNGETVALETGYTGHSLTDEDGQAVPIEYGDSLTLEAYE